MAEHNETADALEDQDAVETMVAAEAPAGSPPPKLKLRRDMEEADPSAPDEADVTLGAETSEPEAAGTTARPSLIAGSVGGLFGFNSDLAGIGFGGERPLRLPMVNRVLAAMLALLVVFTALDLLATIHESARPLGGTPGTLEAGRGGEAPLPAGMPDAAIVLAAYQERPIVQNLEAMRAATATTTVVVTQRGPSWQAAVKEYIDLIGLAPAAEGGQEAIVMDRKTGRLHVLRVGQTMAALDSDFEVVDIQNDHLVLRKGREEVTVK